MVTAAHRPGSAWSADPSTEAVPEATGAQMKVPGEMAVEDGENPLALWMAVVAYEQSTGDAVPLASCHSLMQDGWGSRCSFDRIVPSRMDVLRT